MYQKHFIGNFPFFSLGKYIMREINDVQDAPAYFRYMKEDKVANYIDDYIIPLSLENSVMQLKYFQNLFLSRSAFYWAIAEKNSNLLIGTIGFNFIQWDHKRTEISFDLDSKYFKQGIMSMCLKNLIEFAKKLNLVRIQANTIYSNQAAIAILQKFGFKREGILKKYHIIRKSYVDSLIYALISE